VLLLDVNVVLAVHRGDHPDHESVMAWFDRMLDTAEPFTVPAMVWGSFLRLATNRRIFEIPSPRSEAFSFIAAVDAQPSHLRIGPGARHLILVQELCEEADAAGDLIPDAVLAAIAAEHHCDVVTLDRDFARFSSVGHLRPSLA
jgi:uncharacterized protein